MKNWIQAHPDDDVIVVVHAMQKGDVIHHTGGEIVVNDPVPAFHKVALRDIKKGQPVHKYAESIGTASSDIHRGDHVHTQNLESARGRGDEVHA